MRTVTVAFDGLGKSLVEVAGWRLSPGGRIPFLDC